MSKTKFFKEYIKYKPDIIEIDEDIVVEKLLNCKQNCFHSFKFDCICDKKFKDSRNRKKHLIKKFEMMDYLKNV